MTTNSLVTKVSELLTEKNAKLGIIFNNAFVSKHNNSVAECAALNRYFRIQLSKIRISTIDECECLRDDIAPVYWIKYFETHVLPTLVRFNLPSE